MTRDLQQVLTETGKSLAHLQERCVNGPSNGRNSLSLSLSAVLRARASERECHQLQALALCLAGTTSPIPRFPLTFPGLLQSTLVGSLFGAL